LLLLRLRGEEVEAPAARCAGTIVPACVRSPAAAVMACCDELTVPASVSLVPSQQRTQQSGAEQVSCAFQVPGPLSPIKRAFARFIDTRSRFKFEIVMTSDKDFCA
jgi:hypothetical protein